MIESLKPYWRFSYIAIAQKGKKTNADPFFNLKTVSDKEGLVVVRGQTGCLVLNKYPYAAGHLMALPYRAVAQLEDLTDEETLELQTLIVTGKLLLKKVLNPDGFNVGLNQGKIAGGSVPMHLHWHIVPRWVGDVSFFPIINGGTRIMIRSQESVWKALREAYAAVDTKKAPKKNKRAKR